MPDVLHTTIPAGLSLEDAHLQLAMIAVALGLPLERDEYEIHVFRDPPTRGARPVMIARVTRIGPGEEDFAVTITRRLQVP